MKQKARTIGFARYGLALLSRNVFAATFVLALICISFFGAQSARADIPDATATTGGFSNATSDGATFSGGYTISAGHDPSNYVVFFEIDTDQGFSNPGTTDPATPPSLSNPSVAGLLQGADADTTYYYRFCITSILASGRSCGSAKSFKTLAASPTGPTTVDNTDDPTVVDNTEEPTDVDNTDDPTQVDNTDESSEVDNTDETPANQQPSLTGADKLQNPLGSVDNIPDLIAKILEIIMKISMPIIVIMLIYSGFLYVKAVGKPEEIKKAHQTLLWTVIGAAVILGAWTLAEAISGTINQLK